MATFGSQLQIMKLGAYQDKKKFTVTLNTLIRNFTYMSSCSHAEVLSK